MGKKVKSVKTVDKIIRDSKKDCSNVFFNPISKNNLRNDIHSKFIKTRGFHHEQKSSNYIFI